ncbi:hypothetical protein L596_019628 [Steinernema carpocapsae]|uniref:Mitochondrial mRNA-processing protein COX24 C-terminal domain-containing protein n=1 Tax=Steinernema carpocapsae TaxID=34508 RepID=A0A4U5MR29_STECR|nr:hypothetical protein L596_019628 [Steinernema carpocapsae]
MNRLVSSLSRFSLNSLSGRSLHSFTASTSVVTPPPPSPQIIHSILNPDVDRAIRLPPTLRSPQIYTFPTPERIQKIEAPAPGGIEPIEKLDPLEQKSPVVDPSAGKKTPMIAGPRLLTIRRKKMKKHKRKQRFDRDYFKYQKYHRAKKLNSEREFRAKMKEILGELETFDPMEYVNDTIKRSKREWSQELAPTGRKLYPHWSQLVSLEELYGLETSDYIDKRAGLPNDEDREQIARQKEEYTKKYTTANIKN